MNASDATIRNYPKIWLTMDKRSLIVAVEALHYAFGRLSNLRCTKITMGSQLESRRLSKRGTQQKYILNDIYKCNCTDEPSIEYAKYHLGSAKI